MPVYYAASTSSVLVNGWVLITAFLIVFGVGLWWDLSKGRK